MDDLKKYGRHPIVISWMVTKVFSIAIKGGMLHVFLKTF
jgi:hypothetical protein